MVSGKTGLYGKFGLAANTGHTAIFAGSSFDPVKALGKYPIEGTTAKMNWLWAGGKSTAGTLEIEANKPSFYSQTPSTHTWDINIVQANALGEYVSQGPGTFALTVNCADWALGGARYIGISHPSNLRTFTYTDPAKVANWLDSYN